jgi:hypothetical protein
LLNVGKKTSQAGFIIFRRAREMEGDLVAIFVKTDLIVTAG